MFKLEISPEPRGLQISRQEVVSLLWPLDVRGGQGESYPNPQKTLYNEKGCCIACCSHNILGKALQLNSFVATPPRTYPAFTCGEPTGPRPRQVSEAFAPEANRRLPFPAVPFALYREVADRVAELIDATRLAVDSSVDLLYTEAR